MKRLLMLTPLLFISICNCENPNLNDKDFLPIFSYEVIDYDGPVDPWGKAVGDLNNDGLMDLIVGGNLSGGLVWYKNHSWEKYVISNNSDFSTDHEVADINKDGMNDVISLTRTQLIWFKNPNWTPTIIDNKPLQ